MRQASVERKTKETSVAVTINLDGTGVYDVETGIGFLNHMIEQLARHSLIDITLRAKGNAVSEALGERRGIRRYGAATIPFDETLTRVSLDASNRPCLVWRVEIPTEKLGDIDTQLFKEWFQAFAQGAGITLHVENAYGRNSHHIVESCFKGLARSLRQAIEIDARQADVVPSTKGVLGGSL